MEKKQYLKQYYSKNKLSINRKRRNKYKNDINYREEIKKRVNVYRINNKEKIKLYRLKNKKRRKFIAKRWIKNNKQRIKQWDKKYRNINKEKIKERQRIYYLKNIKKIKERHNKWKNNNPEKAKQSYKNWVKNNKEYFKNKAKKNKQYKLKKNVSSLVRFYLKRKLLNKNHKSTFSFLPYTVDDLIKHLDSLWEPWMNWQNYGRGKGKWTIDHIRPDSYFNYKSVEDEEFQKCWALENLQPMEFIENIKKSNKIIQK